MLAEGKDRLRQGAALLRRFEAPLFTLWAAACTLSSGRTFYGYMLKQTRGEWSAPLDDVFIHFDYARATAQGHPFEWVAGNGYSSGNTSLTYPFVLALGYLSGFQGQRLMIWAAIVAATSVFGVLLAARRLVAPRAGATDTERLVSFLLPPLFLGVGALDWSLWSGMEVAFFLGTWAVALVAYLWLVRARPRELAGRAWLLGLSGLLLVTTRPEAVTTVAVFAVAAGVALRRCGLARAVGATVRAAAPPALGIALQAAANRLLTGEWSAAGALVKLAVYNPFLTREAKTDDYLFNLKYQLFRVTEYHLTDLPALGFLLPALALLSLAFRRTRTTGLLLLAQVAGWTLLVSLNGQVRWQNERYSMPALAWLLVAACLGVAGLVARAKPSRLVLVALGTLAGQAVLASRPPDVRPSVLVGAVLSLAVGAAFLVLLRRPARGLFAGGVLVLSYLHQAPNMRGQKWFFGRACRNILDQHVTAGRFLKGIDGAHRILVGDAGALVYASGLGGLDIIGLGGYRGLPFARAGVSGLASTIELIEHIPPSDRPEILAIYPSWWGVLPTWFAKGEIRRFPAEGNVICGGYEDVLYKADWHLLGSGESPRRVPEGATQIRDAIDVADLLSETEHDYRFDAPDSGYTDMKILPDPTDDRQDMLDGGRLVRPLARERFRVRGMLPNAPAWLVLRSAPTGRSDVEVRVDGAPAGSVHFERTEGWLEREIALPPGSVASELAVELVNHGPDEFLDYHVWAMQ